MRHIPLAGRVYGNSFENVLVAVVVPDKKALESWASSNGASGSFEELCRDPKVICGLLLAVGYCMPNRESCELCKAAPEVLSWGSIAPLKPVSDTCAVRRPVHQ